jgi:hypothetical protein
MARLVLFFALLCTVCLALPQRTRPHRPLTVAATLEAGVVVYLSDGSAWEIRAENRQKAAVWPKGVVVGVYKANSGQYPYRLVLRPGKPDGVVVSAILLRHVK